MFIFESGKIESYLAHSNNEIANFGYAYNLDFRDADFWDLARRWSSCRREQSSDCDQATSESNNAKTKKTKRNSLGLYG